MLYIATLAVVMLKEHRRPAELTAWLFIAFLLPYIGFVGYLMLGKDFRIKKMAKRLKSFPAYEPLPAGETVLQANDTGNEQMAQQDKLFRLLNGLAPFMITSGNESKVLTNGEATFEAILKALDGARHHIHMDYYTIRHDGIGRRFQQTLIRKAREGVEIRIVYDGIGSMHLCEEYVRELEAAGVRICCFLPPRAAFYDRRLNYRNHRKIVIVDGYIGFLGGINIGDEYLGMDSKIGFWRDTHLQLKGSAVRDLQTLFINDWAFTAKEKLILGNYVPRHPYAAGEERVLIVSSEPGRYDQKILEATFAAIMAAKRRICLATPYFIPDPSLMMALRTAARSGVDVTLIIPGIADSKLVLLATLSYVQPLLDAGIKVFRYQKGFIHAKVLLIDEMLASVGTANMDMRSLFSNFELNAILFDPSVIQRLYDDFKEDLLQSKAVDPQQFTNRPWKQKAAESVLNMLSPLL